jgi:hypothetical protein
MLVQLIKLLSVNSAKVSRTTNVLMTEVLANIPYRLNSTDMRPTKKPTSCDQIINRVTKRNFFLFSIIHSCRDNHSG